MTDNCSCEGKVEIKFKSTKLNKILHWKETKQLESFQKSDPHSKLDPTG